MVTQSAALWQHWQQIDRARWMPARGTSVQDMRNQLGQLRPLVMLDAALPGLPGWDDAEWTTLLHDLKVLVLSARPSDEEGHKALGRGVYGYAHAWTPAPSLNIILQSISEGSLWLGRSLMQRLLRDIDARLPPPETPETPDWAKPLSSREQEVARLASMGHGNPDIAERLNITERTVRAHLSAIFEKLQVSDRLMLALRVHGIGR